MGSRSPFQNHGRPDSSARGGFAGGMIVPFFMLRFPSCFQILVLILFLFIGLGILLMSPYSMLICLKRDQGQFHSSMEKRQRKSEQKFLEKKRELPRKLLQLKKARRSKCSFQTPLSMEGHPVDPETGEVLAEDFHRPSIRTRNFSHQQHQRFTCQIKNGLKGLKHTKSFQ